MSVDLPEDYIPTDDEPYMNPRQIEYFRRQLIAWRENLLAESEKTLNKLKEDKERDIEAVDQGTNESATAFELRTRDRYRKLIKKIERALERISNGTYGYCEETEEEIGIRRLLARPIATLSLEAQERHEREKKKREARSG
ncbi:MULTISPECIES: RNA polymerase-binding protein DksA [Desulfococcus]|jgi:DnaK suppressor protein|uniref:RNA polymerase-binding transcription factor DksA n=1 Tax=Desulfococcus multivorans DSM 2059 TaxID=1121405 RepID=S7U460_DESML|nr:RNA polymerase-binding protein DksA [Desulfococcus multivorans]AOY59011.1 DksA2: RNA polymerase-binding protein [Desulfococcus multivorans]AQV01273.1 RNA polymerase-binding protein DksA [Desulfococcus multivorans]EPR43760.1 transcriptional regulator, TraR/DksA family [Desulfococcus multivorans DSM 2059]MDX9818012.1 RNA polymerase-binding protein DksA [Desulfococcus multivorans]SJZ55439.1 transcriptional regulator, TraR/DksA family [Desulfococcus multivorans DSM 2059]